MSFDNNKSLPSFVFENKLIEVLGEEMCKYCVENPNKTIAFRGLFSLAVADFDRAHGIDSVISNNLIQIRKELGEELCVWYANNHKGLADILILLNDYINAYEKTKKFKEKLKLLIVKININNYKAKVIPLIFAFGTEDGRDGLFKLIKRAHIKIVKDLSRILLTTIDEQEKVPLIRFLEWLKEDRNTRLRDGLKSLFKKDRDENIIRKRVEGFTLEETSKDYAITHEGVRRIEKRYQERFDDYVDKVRPHYIIYAFGQNSGYISFGDVERQLGQYAKIFIYYLQKNNCSTLHWSRELNGFIIGDGKWYKQLNNYKKKDLPEMFEVELLDRIIFKIVENLEITIAFKEIEKIVLADYFLLGKVYLKQRMSLFQIYKYVLKKFYPYGISVYDNVEIGHFRYYVHDLFGNIYLPESNRAIAARLNKITILCDKGKRILPSEVKISSELLEKMHDKILDLDENEISFSMIFDIFKDKLLKESNITNKYFLQGVLKLNYSKEFDFTRYTIKKKVEKIEKEIKLMV